MVAIFFNVQGKTKNHITVEYIHNISIIDNNGYCLFTVIANFSCY